MKTPVTIGIAGELLERIAGFKIEKIMNAEMSSCNNVVLIKLVADLSEKELSNDTYN